MKKIVVIILVQIITFILPLKIYGQKDFKINISKYNDHKIEKLFKDTDTTCLVIIKKIDQYTTDLNSTRSLKKERVLALKDSIIILQDSLVDNLINKYLKMKDSMISYNVAISEYDFFKINDISVFNINYKKIDTLNLSSCHIKHYLAISLIRELDSILNTIPSTIIKIEKQEYLINSSKEIINKIIKNNIDKSLSYAEILIDKIDSYIEILSKDQQEYFRPKLIDKFNEYIKFSYIDE